MTTSPVLRRRARRLPLVVVFAASLLFGAACTPQEAVWLHFFQNGSPQLHEQAQRVVHCESRWDPGAVSPTNDHGLFQINRRWHEASFTQVTGQPWHRVYDPYWNAVYARHVHDSQGWAAWSCRP